MFVKHIMVFSVSRLIPVSFIIQVIIIVQCRCKHKINYTLNGILHQTGLNHILTLNNPTFQSAKGLGEKPLMHMPTNWLPL